MNKQTTQPQYTNADDLYQESPFFSLVYCSQVTTGVGDADVDAIIAASRRRNAVLGITGILVFGSGVFFQWIEGPKTEVLELIKLIESDRRHEMMVTLSTDEEVRERIFPSWDMELVDAENIQEVLQDALETAQDQKSVEALNLMLSKVQGHA
ncbi:BLUF domain-containing protein [Luminiphilus sp. nBUS_16]|uniref:BLUF domain-containing protein n=1 Tax=unclassified Luminiphilus TaxID=2633198 RepID=UPI003EBB6B7C